MGGELAMSGGVIAGGDIGDGWPVPTPMGLSGGVAVVGKVWTGQGPVSPSPEKMAYLHQPLPPQISLKLLYTGRRGVNRSEHLPQSCSRVLKCHACGEGRAAGKGLAQGAEQGEGGSRGPLALNSL